MTKDEFYHRAYNRPTYSEPSIWMLIVDQLTVHDEPVEFPNVHFQHRDVTPVYYPDLESCERLIEEYVMLEKSRLESQRPRPDWIEDEELNCSVYAFHVYQLPIGVMLNHVKESVYHRVYDKNGVLLDESMCAEIMDSNDTWEELQLDHYFGRPADKIRFKPGDLVEFDSCVGVVGNTRSMDIDFQWQLHQKVADEIFPFYSDYSDDSYYVVTDKEGGHAHVHACELFPLQLPIPEDYMAQLKELSEFVKSNHKS